MIRLVRAKRLRELKEAEALLEEYLKWQQEAEAALTSPDRATRRRAWRESWSTLPSRGEVDADTAR